MKWDAFFDASWKLALPIQDKLARHKKIVCTKKSYSFDKCSNTAEVTADAFPKEFVKVAFIFFFKVNFV
jgi:hypothetical protein